MAEPNPLLFSQESHDLELDTQTNYPPAKNSFPDPPSSTDLEARPPNASSQPPSSEEDKPAVLALPAPENQMSDEAGRAPTVEINSPTEGVAGGVFKFDALGPMVVNSDGTLSRITNWGELSEGERERTVRLLVKKRNLVRLASHAEPSPDPSPPTSRPESPSRNQDPSAAPSSLPAPPPSSSHSASPYQAASIADSHPHSTSTEGKNQVGSDTNEQKEVAQTDTGTTVDPHEANQGATRSIEEKVVDLMKAVDKEEGVLGEEAGKGKEGEVPTETSEARGEEGTEVKVVNLGSTDITGVA